MKIDLYSRVPGSSERDRERQLVEARIDETRYGIDIMRVAEVVTPRPLVPVPGAPAHVIGITDHRDRAVPVVDLRRCLGLEGSPGPRAKWIIIDVDGTDTAILVDRVIGVVVVHGRERRDRHPLMSGLDTRWIRDVWGHGDGLIFEMDLVEVTGGAREALERAAGTEEGR